MVNSGGYNNVDEAVAEAQNVETDDTAVTESGEISTGANSNEIFSDSAAGEANSAAESDEDGGREGDGKNNQ